MHALCASIVCACMHCVHQCEHALCASVHGILISIARSHISVISVTQRSTALLPGCVGCVIPKVRHTVNVVPGGELCTAQKKHQGAQVPPPWYALERPHYSPADDLVEARRLQCYTCIHSQWKSNYQLFVSLLANDESYEADTVSVGSCCYWRHWLVSAEQLISVVSAWSVVSPCQVQRDVQYTLSPTAVWRAWKYCALLHSSHIGLQQQLLPSSRLHLPESPEWAGINVLPGHLTTWHQRKYIRAA